MLALALSCCARLLPCGGFCSGCRWCRRVEVETGVSTFALAPCEVPAHFSFAFGVEYTRCFPVCQLSLVEIEDLGLACDCVTGAGCGAVVSGVLLCLFQISDYRAVLRWQAVEDRRQYVFVVELDSEVVQFRPLILQSGDKRCRWLVGLHRDVEELPYGSAS